MAPRIHLPFPFVFGYKVVSHRSIQNLVIALEQNWFWMGGQKKDVQLGIKCFLDKMPKEDRGWTTCCQARSKDPAQAHVLLSLLRNPTTENQSHLSVFGQVFSLTVCIRKALLSVLQKWSAERLGSLCTHFSSSVVSNLLRDPFMAVLWPCSGNN